jgi:hypothetical protein
MRVTVIPEDQVILVGGVTRVCEFTADANIHAIQWYDDYGTFEYKVGAAEQFTDFAIVSPFVDVWEANAPPPVEPDPV